MQPEPVPEQQYPPKPTIPNEPKKSVVVQSLFSAVLFLVSFYFLFHQDIVYVLLLMLVLVIHELGHFGAMKMFNYSDVKMFFVPFLGAFVAGEEKEISGFHRAVIILAGPLPGIIMGLGLYAYAWNDSGGIIPTLAGLFVFVNLFNLLPFSPLDGGRLTEILFFDSRRKLQTIFTIVSCLLLVLVSIKLKSFIFLVLPLFMAYRIFLQYKIQQVKLWLGNQGIDYNQPYEAISDKDYFLTRQRIISEVPGYGQLHPFIYDIPAKEKHIIQLIQSFAEPPPIKRLPPIAKYLFVGLWLILSILAVLAIFVISN